MAHMVPEEMLDFDPKSREDVIFKALRKGLDDKYWVFHSFSVNQTSLNGAFYEKEVDFLVYHREKGILCIEAKNGSGISYGGGEWRELMQISPNPGAMTNMTHCFVATGVEKVAEQHFDEHECLTVHLLDRDEVFRHMNDGSMVQSLMLAPLWRYFCECAD